MKKEYTSPEMSVLVLQFENVVRTSATELPEDPVGDDWLSNE